MAKTTQNPRANAARARAARNTRGNTGRPAGLFTWLLVALVGVVIVVVVVVKVTSSPGSAGKTLPTPSAIAAEVTGVPASVFNTIGVSTSVVQVAAPTAISGQTPLNWKIDGKVLPTIFYYGAEYCPYCAAQRWPMIIALSRFGTFTHLYDTESSPIDVYKDTPTFSLAYAKYSSPYLHFVPIEFATNVPSNNGSKCDGYVCLQNPTNAEYAIVTKYDNGVYVPQAEAGSIPFIDFNNKYLIIGASFVPSNLAGVSRSTIAAALTDPSDFLTQGIITSANLFSAAVCQITNQQPATVCGSAGVRAADAAMKIKVS